jgi:hypothetical protein
MSQNDRLFQEVCCNQQRGQVISLEAIMLASLNAGGSVPIPAALSGTDGEKRMTMSLVIIEGENTFTLVVGNKESLNHWPRRRKIICTHCTSLY